MNTEDLKHRERTGRGNFYAEREDTQEPLDRLVQEGRYEELRDNPEFQSRKIKDRIRLAKKAVRASLKEANDDYWEIGSERADAPHEIFQKDLEDFLNAEIQPKRELLKVLNACLVGSVRMENAPNEVKEVLSLPRKAHSDKKAA